MTDINDIENTDIVFQGESAGQDLGIGSMSPQNRYKNNIPERLSSEYEEAARSSEILSLTDDIALIEAGIQDALRRMSQQDPGQLWIKGRNTYKDLVYALRRQDDRESTMLMTELGRILDMGYNDYLAWMDVERKQEIKRKMVDSERKRRVDMRMMITAEELMDVIGHLADSIRRNVIDPDARAKLSKDMRRLLSKKGFRTADSE